MDNLFSPFVELRIGSAIQLRNQFAGFDLWLSRKEPADICDFTLLLGLPELGLVKDMPAEICIGYDLDHSWSVFSGVVTEPCHPRYLCKDDATQLFQTKIVQTFLNVTPQDILRFGLRAAGVTDMNLDPTIYIRKPRFVAAGENVSDLVRRINATWGLSHDWYFTGKKFNWSKPVPQSGPVYSYQYGVNIISLEFSADREPQGQRSAGATSGAGKLLTVVSPFVGHSQEIEVVYPDVKSTRFMVETVHHFLNDAGVLRSELYFREMEAA